MGADSQGEPDPRFKYGHSVRGYRIGILDTDCLFDDVIYQATGGRISSQFPAVKVTSVLGSTLYFASLHVFDEMYRPDKLGHANKFEKMARQAASSGMEISVTKFQRVFEDEFLPLIRFIDMSGVLADHDWAAAVASVDVKDQPTGQLCALLAGASPVIYARDKSLRRPGLAPESIGPVVAANLAADLGDGMLYSGAIGVTAAGAVMHRGIKAGTGALEVSPYVGYLIVLAIAVWAFSNRDRRERAFRITKPILDVLFDAMERADAGRDVIEAHSISPPAQGQSIEAGIAMTLAFAETSLLATEIREILKSQSQFEMLSVTDVRMVLNRELSCFVRSGRSRWQLGKTMTGVLAN
jgi:hypothetical protein